MTATLEPLYEVVNSIVETLPKTALWVIIGAIAGELIRRIVPIEYQLRRNRALEEQQLRQEWYLEVRYLISEIMIQGIPLQTGSDVDPDEVAAEIQKSADNLYEYSLKPPDGIEEEAINAAHTVALISQAICKVMTRVNQETVPDVIGEALDVARTMDADIDLHEAALTMLPYVASRVSPSNSVDGNEEIAAFLDGAIAGEQQFEPDEIEQLPWGMMSEKLEDDQEQEEINDTMRALFQIFLVDIPEELLPAVNKHVQ